MQTVTLPHIATNIAKPGLGCMGMSEFYGQSNDKQSLQLLDKALAHGINFFDSADIYGFGHNEKLLGQFLHKHRTVRAQIVLATKFGIVREQGAYQRTINNRPEYIHQACDASLQRLGTDYIDLYYCHRRNPDVPIEEVIGAMAELVQAGKVRAIGLSEINTETLQRAHAVHPITAVQSEYSLWSRQAEQDILPLTQSLGIAFIAYSPLGRAFLTGTVDPNALDKDDFRRALPRLQGEALAHNRKRVTAFSEVGKAWGYSNAQLCLAWMMNKYPHLIPIVGTRREKYLMENSTAADIRLSREQVAQLDKLFDPGQVMGARYPDAGWTGIES